MKIKREFPDAIVIDEFGDVKLIEFELFASNFIAHGHDPDKCDYIICWENDLDESVEDETVNLKTEIVFCLFS